jgi:hypothetical protein
VDVIAETTSRIEYYRLEETLRELGFVQDIAEGGPIGRWSVGGLIVDVMPTDERILGFSLWILGTRTFPRTASAYALAM